MKTRNFVKWCLGLNLAVLPLAGGCLQDAPSPAVHTGAALTSTDEAPVVYDVTPPAPTTESVNVAVESEAEPSAITNLTEAKVEVISTNLPAPPDVNLTPAAAELAKLANAGVDEQVMLTFVTNSPSTFNLGAEEIIYLNDLGVPGHIVTAMIQRDQALKAQGAEAMAASIEANTPQQQASDTQAPAPADVAPQATAPPPSAPAQAQAQPAPPPQAEVTTAQFEPALAPYGTWVYVSGYGRCWRPTVAVVNTGWSPYFDGGRWVYTDWGWYWVSDYSWGWAPFHYGRWFRHTSWGWCWAPDVVWGPAWVSWRYSDAYCGWAPLPPGAYFSVGIGITFHGHRAYDWHHMGIHHHGHYVAWRNFDRHGLRAHAVPERERDNIYRNTTVVNNIRVNNNTVINSGVPRERVAAATHRDIRPVRVRETSDASVVRTGRRAEQLRGDTLTVYRPVRPQEDREGAAIVRTGATRTRTESGNRVGSPTATRTETTAPARGGTRELGGSPREGTVAREGAPGREQREPAVARQAGNTPRQPQTSAAEPRQPRVSSVPRQPGTRLTDNSESPETRTAPPLTRAPEAMQPRTTGAGREAQPVPRTPITREAQPVQQQRSPSVAREPQPVQRQAPAVSVQRNESPTPRASTPPARTEAPRPAERSAPAYQAPSRPTPAPRASVAMPTRSASAYTPSVSGQNPAAAMSQPQRSYSRQTPSSYNAPAVARQPSYSPPAVPASRPVPTVSSSVPRYSSQPQRSYMPGASIAQGPRYSPSPSPSMSSPRAPASQPRPAAPAPRADTSSGRARQSN